MINNEGAKDRPDITASEISAAPTPELTLHPSSDEPVMEVVSISADNTLADIDDGILSDEERKMVNEVANQLDLGDSTMILQYGVAAQKKMADFAESSLLKVRTKDLGEVGDLVTGVVTELRGFDADEEKGFFGFFKKSANKLETLKTRYDRVDSNINKIVKVLKEDQVTLIKDSAMLDKMYELNLTYFKELTMYILAGKRKLEDVKNGELVELTAKAKETGRPEDAQAVRDLNERITRFERKLHDLALTRQISLQTAPQIRFVQSGEIAMIEKIQTALTSTIPLWKNQMVIALSEANAKEAVKTQAAVSEMTNDLLKKNAEMLEATAVQIAKESERGIVDIETLQQTNESLIRTFDEVLQVQREGRQKREEAEKELRRIEGELKAKLLEAQG